MLATRSNVVASSTSNGRTPSRISPIEATAITSASTDWRPRSAQYTSSRYSHSANSSIVSPMPTPKANAHSS